MNGAVRCPFFFMIIDYKISDNNFIENVREALQFAIQEKAEIVVLFDGINYNSKIENWFKTGCKNYVTCLKSDGREIINRVEKDFKIKYVSEPGDTMCMTIDTAKLILQTPEDITTKEKLGKFLIKKGIPCIEIV
jgi:hypothetical protein